MSDQRRRTQEENVNTLFCGCLRLDRFITIFVIKSKSKGQKKNAHFKTFPTELRATHVLVCIHRSD